MSAPDELDENLLYREESYALIGAAIEVYNELGSGFLESVYEAAMIEELHCRDVPIAEQVELGIFYKGKPLPTRFRADLVAYGKVIVELKATKALTSIDEAQVINYLRASDMRLGLLFNFGSPRLEWRRLVK